MNSRAWLRLLAVAALAAACGCNAAPVVQVETVIHADGSCDRTIWQPKDDLLPAGALQPAWKARWTSFEQTSIPPELGQDRRMQQASDGHAYFSARGKFACIAEIPAHFRAPAQASPELGASELARSYEVIDYGFVREHRFRETLTNFVTRERFLKARDELLKLVMPLLVQGIEQVYGPDYDVRSLVGYCQGDGRRFLEQASLIFYDTMARHIPGDEQLAAYAVLGRQFGLDLLDPAGNVAGGEDAQKRCLVFLRHRIALGLRHRDGGRLTDLEIQSILDTSNSGRFTKRWDAYLNPLEPSFKNQIAPRIFQMTGPYNLPLSLFASGDPLFVFDLRLPGTIAETTGLIAGPDHARWRFKGDQSFPAGFVMDARSFEIDSDGQRKILGHVPINDPNQVPAYVEPLGAGRNAPGACPESPQNRSGPMASHRSDLARRGSGKAVDATALAGSGCTATLKNRSRHGCLFF